MSVEPTQPSEPELTKEEFIAACVTDGTPRDVCEARWNAAHETNPAVPPPPPSSAATGTPSMGDILRENEMLRGENKMRREQVKKLLDLHYFNDQKEQARLDAERQDKIKNIIADSNGKWTIDELKDKTNQELTIIKLAVDKSLNNTFASIAAYDAEMRRKKKPQLTAGAWDPEKKKWVGGM